MNPGFLMDPRVLSAIISLVDRSLASNQALKAIKAGVEQRAAQGKPFTFDDLKGLQLPDDQGRDALVEAIDTAEE